MFLVAKTAPAARLLWVLAGYLLNATGMSEQNWTVPLLAAVVLFTLIVLSGIQRSNLANIAIVSITLLSLGFVTQVACSSINRFKQFYTLLPNSQSRIG